MSAPEMRNISDIPVTTAYLFRLFCRRRRARADHEARPLSLLITWLELEIVETASFVDDTFFSLHTYAPFQQQWLLLLLSTCCSMIFDLSWLPLQLRRM